MTATAIYCVYVSDDNGWLSECPDHEGVFFGRIPPTGTYVPMSESEFGGHVEFADRDEAEAYAELLAETGDWQVRTPRGNGPVQRPTYAVATRLPEPFVECGDATMSYTEARTAWENGEFSQWVENNDPANLQFCINGDVHGLDGAENALSDDQWD